MCAETREEGGRLRRKEGEMRGEKERECYDKEGSKYLVSSDVNVKPA